MVKTEQLGQQIAGTVWAQVDASVGLQDVRVHQHLPGCWQIALLFKADAYGQAYGANRNLRRRVEAELKKQISRGVAESGEHEWLFVYQTVGKSDHHRVLLSTEAVSPLQGVMTEFMGSPRDVRVMALAEAQASAKKKTAESDWAVTATSMAKNHDKMQRSADGWWDGVWAALLGSGESSIEAMPSMHEVLWACSEVLKNTLKQGWRSASAQQQGIWLKALLQQKTLDWQQKIKDDSQRWQQCVSRAHKAMYCLVEAYFTTGLSGSNSSVAQWPRPGYGEAGAWLHSLQRLLQQEGMAMTPKDCAEKEHQWLVLVTVYKQIKLLQQQSVDLDMGLDQADEVLFSFTKAWMLVCDRTPQIQQSWLLYARTLVKDQGFFSQWVGWLQYWTLIDAGQRQLCWQKVQQMAEQQKAARLAIEQILATLVIRLDALGTAASRQSLEAQDWLWVEDDSADACDTPTLSQGDVIKPESMMKPDDTIVPVQSLRPLWPSFLTKQGLWGAQTVSAAMSSCCLKVRGQEFVCRQGVEYWPMPGFSRMVYASVASQETTQALQAMTPYCQTRLWHPDGLWTVNSLGEQRLWLRYPQSIDDGTIVYVFHSLCSQAEVGQWSKKTPAEVQDLRKVFFAATPEPTCGI